MAHPNTNYNNMQFLSVNPEDYLIAGQRRSSVVLPALGTTSTSTLDVRTSSPVPLMRISSSSRDISRLDKNGNIYASIASSLNKSTESLCFGIARKKQHRLQRRDSSVYRPRCYTDPVQQQQVHVNSTLMLPPQKLSANRHQGSSTLIPSPFFSNHGQERRSSNALSSLVEQTVQVTSASMGLNGSIEQGLQVGQTDLSNDEKSVKLQTSSSNADYANAPWNYPVAVLAAGVSNTDAKRINCLDMRDNKSNPAHQQFQKPHNRPQYNSYDLSGSSTALGSGAGQLTITTTRTLVNGSTKYSPTSSTDFKSLKQGGSGINPLETSASTASVRSISPARKSVNSSGSITAKHEQSSLVAAAATAAAAASSSSSSATSAAVIAAAPTDKEKKRKEVSGSRVKKFHRHFSQVSKDEKLINYFSCALVSDILLQGHLYITDQHFAFYSNVFGYVTKVVIPTSSVTKISKEKTAKIIPNAVGVATADERHVFGSFISREAAFRLMCSVCPPLAPVELLLPCKMPSDVLEYSEELSIEDDSSCSISGNESPPQAGTVNNTGQTLMRRNMATDKLLRHSDIPNNAKSFHSSLASAARASAPPTAHYNNNNNNHNNSKNNTNISSAPSQTVTNLNNNNTNNNNNFAMASLTTLLNTPTSTGVAASAAAAAATATTPATSITMIITGTASSTSNSTSSTPSPSSVSSTSLPTTVLNTPKTAAQVSSTSFKALSKRLEFPKELHVVYLGVLLSILLALFSGFLLYRILDIEAKTSLFSRAPVVNWGSVNDDDIFTEALRWQKELQMKSTEEAQIILNANLEQIAKVRRSLETLAMLIHDRSSSAADSATANVADAFKCDEND